jgi:hypothetical protein
LHDAAAASIGAVNTVKPALWRHARDDLCSTVERDMTRTQHTIDADIYVKFRVSGLDDGFESTTIRAKLIFSYLQGSPGCGPRYSHGGLPPDPAEVSLVDVKLIDGDGLDPTREQLVQWAEDYLESDNGYKHACHCAEDARSAFSRTY